MKHCPLYLAAFTAFTLLFTPLLEVQAQEALKYDLRDERVAGLTLEFPAEFARAGGGGKGVDLEFTMRLTNNRAEPVSIKKWELLLQAKNIGQNDIAGGELRAKFATLAPGESHELKGHLFLAPMNQKGAGLGVAMGKGKGRKSSFERLHGDALAGLLMTIDTTSGDEYRVYLAKYHYDAAADTVTAYFTLGQ